MRYTDLAGFLSALRDLTVRGKVHKDKWPLARLGQVPDAEIARELGVSRERVRQVRAEYGVPAFKVKPPACGFCGGAISKKAKACRKCQPLKLLELSTSSLVYRVWNNMIQRCSNPNHPSYERYGGRGLSACRKWHSFYGFYEDMGLPPKGYTLERVDNTKGYSKSNCKWASFKEQANNRREQKRIRKKIVIFLHLYNSNGWSMWKIFKNFNISYQSMHRIKRIYEPGIH